MLKRNHRIHAKKSFHKSDSKIDLPILVNTIILVILGLVIVYDASVVQAFKDFGDKYYYIKQQLIWVVLGFSALFFCSFFNYQNYKKLSFWFFLISFVLLLAVFIPGLGVATGGAHRWLKIGSLFSIQPTEIIKLSTILFLSSIFSTKPNIKIFGVIVVLISFIIGFLQKDLGSTVVFFLSTITIYIVSGASLKYFATLVPVTLIGFIFFVLSSTYRKQRILAFLDPFSDPQGYSYHISQVLIALGSGGLFGLGIGQSRQKFEYIPEVTTDSIFAIVGEEFGFFGAIFLIALIFYLVYRGFKIADNTDDRFGKLLAFGLSSWLGVQAIVNLAAMVSLIPLTGVPLPFISYGGSALLVNLVAVGILLNISRSSRISSK